MEKKEIPMRHRILSRVVTTALSLGVLGALGTLASGDQAKPRGQSGGGSGSSGAGVRHHSPSGGSSRSNSGGSNSGGSNSGGPSRSLSPAESRHPRAGTGTGYRGYGYGYGNGYGYGYGYGYRPYYYSPGWGYWYNPGYYPSYYYGYWPYWGSSLAFGVGGYGYGGGGYSMGGYYGAPEAYRSNHYSDAGALRLLIDPEDTKVYVDGYYAGEVDDFDGLTQRLNLAPGRHEILLKRDGYRTHRIKVYLEPNTTVKLRHDMEKGLGPDTLEDLAGERGLDEERRRSAHRAEDESEDDRAPETQGRPQSREDVRPTLRLPAPSPDGSATPGLLALRVTPDDASVYVDGRFFGSARQTGEIELSRGPHRVEIVRPGYKTIERDVMIEAGRTLTLGMALDRP